MPEKNSQLTIEIRVNPLYPRNPRCIEICILKRKKSAYPRKSAVSA